MNETKENGRSSQQTNKNGNNERKPKYIKKVSKHRKIQMKKTKTQTMCIHKTTIN